MDSARSICATGPEQRLGVAGQHQPAASRVGRCPAVGQHPRVLAAAALARVHDEAALAQGDAGEPARDHLDLVAAQHERAAGRCGDPRGGRRPAWGAARATRPPAPCSRAGRPPPACASPRSRRRWPRARSASRSRPTRPPASPPARPCARSRGRAGPAPTGGRSGRSGRIGSAPR